tara:strand:+ start:93 stop:359 length:267 start_codon:yes stop_codon:yes gene_type:complete
MKKNRVKFNPIGEKVLVQVHPFEKLVNGIYRVDHLQENHKGSVVSTNNSIPVYIDDVVIYNPNAGVPVNVEGSDYILLRIDEIYGIEA